MNQEQLAKIEQRWLAASGGPWTVDDMTSADYGIRLTTREAVERLQADVEIKDPHHGNVRITPPRKLETVVIGDFQTALESGVVRDIEEWTRLVEERAFGPLDFERVAGRCRLIYAMPRAIKEARERAVDKTAFTSRASKHDEPEPSFAVLTAEQSGDCKSADIEFLIHATEDVGTLISEVRRQEAKIAELTSALADARRSEGQAIASRDSLRMSVASMLSAAHRVIAAGGDS